MHVLRFENCGSCMESEDSVWILISSLHGFHELSSCRQPWVLSSKLSHRPSGLYCNKYVFNVQNERS